ncbi:STAS domain-containing protein [Amycolatopsis sp. NPDC051903]|uniref:STAS domain-containing protein n=1 Tax=Amycolatopsis sp. NPDC051903 TaxID=3363936 RepID=UPI0037AA132F
MPVMQGSDQTPNSAAAAAAEVGVHRGELSVVLTARGDFDAVTSPDLQDAIAEVFVDPPPVLVIDLTETSFIGSAAIAALIEAQRNAGTRTSVRLVAPHNVRRVLGLLGLDQQFVLHDTVRSAVAAE